MHRRFTVHDVVSSKQAIDILKKFGSPLYVYKEAIICQKVRRLREAAREIQICYALKANTNSHLVSIIRTLGIQHIDVVSPGEIYRALACGYTPSNIMYTQNFISQEDLDYALKAGVTMNIGALQTLIHYKNQLKGKNIFLRINPKIGAGSSHHVITGGPSSKFGIYESDIPLAIKIAKENDIHIVGLHQHIGSNMKKKDEETIFSTMRYIFEIVELFDEVKSVNIGGGLGVAYRDTEEVSQPSTIFEKVRQIRDEFSKKYNRQISLFVQPGRYIIADSAVLLCKITATKSTPQRGFIGTDTGFNHLIRPALYGSHHEIVNITNPNAQKHLVNVCGNICECTDNLGVDLHLGGDIGDILAIQNTGAYGFAMSSNYNQRPKPAEVLIQKDNEELKIIRRRENFEDLIDKL